MRSLTRTYPCRLDELSACRVDVETWLLENDADEETREAVVLAAHELVADAVTAEGCVGVHVTGGFLDSEIWLEVRAEGAWEPPAPSYDEDGFGIELVNRLMDQVKVVASEGRASTRVLARRTCGPKIDADV